MTLVVCARAGTLESVVDELSTGEGVLTPVGCIDGRCSCGWVGDAADSDLEVGGVGRAIGPGREISSGLLTCGGDCILRGIECDCGCGCISCTECFVSLFRGSDRKTSLKRMIGNPSDRNPGSA